MLSVDFGWHAPSYPVDGSDPNSFLEQIETHLQLIDSHVTSVWVDDHVHPWGNFMPRETPATEVMTTLAYLAARYPNFDWGSLVLCQSYRNPALTAKMAASLQWLTGGGTSLALAPAGWRRSIRRTIGRFRDRPPAFVSWRRQLRSPSCFGQFRRPAMRVATIELRTPTAIRSPFRCRR